MDIQQRRNEEAKKLERQRLARPRIGERPWLPLDNASKIFLSTMTSIDTKVFRLTAGMTELVRPELLQEALDTAYDSFPLYHGIIRRGIFWYFVEESDLRPKVEEESDIPCAQIYATSYRGLLFRVLYRDNRIHLEVFHALSDGNGAISFFQLLLISYLRLCRLADGKVSEAVLPYYIATDSNRDSFAEYFKNKVEEAKEEAKTEAKAEPEAIVSAPPEPADVDPPPVKVQSKAPIYRIRGAKTLDGRMNVMELHLRTSKILTAARAAGGTVTSYLSAIFMQAIYETIPVKKRQRHSWQIVLSVPVDLRQFYPSLTSRNFFATVMLRHVFIPGETIDLAALTDELSDQLKQEGSKDKISRKVAKLVKLESSWPLRVTPLYAKDLILRIGNSINNLGITASMTNVGRFRLPGEITDDMQECLIMTSAVRPQFSVASYDNDLAITFTSPKMSTAIQDRFREILEGLGFEIAFAVESVTPETEFSIYKQPHVSGTSGQVTDDKQGRTSADYPPYPLVPVETNLPLAQRLLLLISLLGFLLYAAVNSLWGLDLPFSILALAIGTLWVMVTGILGNRHNPAWAILLQTMVISVALIGADLLSGWRGWSLTWALPIVNVSSLLGTQITLMASRKALERGVFFLQAHAILALLPVLFIILGWVDPLWPSVTATSLAALSFVLTAILRRRVLDEEVRRKLHL